MAHRGTFYFLYFIKEKQVSEVLSELPEPTLLTGAGAGTRTPADGSQELSRPAHSILCSNL